MTPPASTEDLPQRNFARRHPCALLLLALILPLSCVRFYTFSTDAENRFQIVAFGIWGTVSLETKSFYGDGKDFRLAPPDFAFDCPPVLRYHDPKSWEISIPLWLPVAFLVLWIAMRENRFLRLARGANRT